MHSQAAQASVPKGAPAGAASPAKYSKPWEPEKHALHRLLCPRWAAGRVGCLAARGC